MNILIAPDKFKGTLTASRACQAIREGLGHLGADFVFREMPLADGGEGTLDVFAARGGTVVDVPVHDPLMRPITASYVRSNDGITAYIEMARASGLWLLNPSEYDPMHTSSFGTGELIRNAVEGGATQIFLGIGGSACNDAGTGMMAALGMKFLDEEGRSLVPNGASLKKIIRVDDSSLIAQAKDAIVIALSDVTNPFYGPAGAAYTYGPQKGATPGMVIEMDQGLGQVAVVVRKNSGIDLQEISGSGAGGGIAGGAVAWLNATIMRGVDVIFETLQVNRAIAWADIVISGEGKLDHTSLLGKVVSGVTERAAALNKPVVLICGQYEREIAWTNTTIFSLVDFAGERTSFEEAYDTLQRLTHQKVVPHLRAIANTESG